MSTVSQLGPVAAHMHAPEQNVSLFRLYALRATYLLLVVGMGFQIWPLIVHHGHPWSLMQGVADCMLGAMSALAALGLRYPLKMLPILFFELVWKATWLLAVAWPLWRAGPLDADTAETAKACLMGVIFLIVIPWRHVWRSYVAAPAERWR